MATVSWRRGRTYRPGQLVSFHGLLYQTVRATQMQPPGAPWYVVVDTVTAFSPTDSSWWHLVGSFESVLLTNGESDSIRIGQPVYISGENTCRLAKADSEDKARVCGLVKSGAVDGGNVGAIAIRGLLEATADQWDTVTGEHGGLLPGADYYLSSVPGGLTRSAPSSVGQFVVPMGVAQSHCGLLLQIRSRVRL